MFNFAEFNAFMPFSHHRITTIGLQIKYQIFDENLKFNVLTEFLIGKKELNYNNRKNTRKSIFCESN